MEFQALNKMYGTNKAPRFLFAFGIILATAMFFLVNREFSTELTFLGHWDRTRTVLALLMLFLLQVALSWLAGWRRAPWGIGYLLRMAGILLVVVAIRSVCILYNVDVAATMGEACSIILTDQPVIWLIHGGIQAVLILTDWALRLKHAKCQTASVG